MNKRLFFPTFLGFLALATQLLAPPAWADVYLGLGGGIQHTEDFALQLAARVHGSIEAHYSRWDDRRRVGALGVGYRLRTRGAFSFVIGAAYVGRDTRNLLRRGNAYVEIRFRPPSARFSCQLGHYSSVGKDKGENLLLCGLHWGARD